LSIVTNDPLICEDIINKGFLEKLDHLPKNYFDLLRFLRALSLMVGNLCENKAAQIALGKRNYTKIFHKGLGIFPDDPPLNQNVCYALA